MLLKAGHLEPASQAFQQCLTMLAALPEPQRGQVAVQAAGVYGNLGVVLLRGNQPAEALPLLAKSLEMCGTPL